MHREVVSETTNRPMPPDSTDLSDDEFASPSGRHSILNFVADSIVFVEPSASLRDVAVRLHSSDVGLVVVRGAGLVEGVVSERDIVRAVALDIDLDNTAVDEIETEDLKWATTTSTVDDVAEEMLENYLRHVLVGDDEGDLAGVVSIRDVLSAYLV